MANKCKHVSTVCNYCKANGHLQAVCSNTLKSYGNHQAHAIEVDDIYETSTLDIFQLNLINGISAKFLVNLIVDKVRINFQIDTGSW